MPYRDYQNYACESVFNYFINGGTGNPLVGSPTGTGKSLMIGGLVHKTFQRYGKQRILMLTHVKELVAQNHKVLLWLWPTAPVGIFCAGLGRKDKGQPVIYASIASIYKELENMEAFDLVLIDEAHMVSPDTNIAGKEDATYSDMYGIARQHLLRKNPNVKFIGFSATLYRSGLGSLTNGGVFTDICLDMTTMEWFNWFLYEGYLARLVPKKTANFLDTTGVKTVAGDFNQKQLNSVVNKESVTKAILEEAVAAAYEDNRAHWLLFACGIDHVKSVHHALQLMGIKATYVHSKMKDKERDENIAKFKAREFTVMVNDLILTTGFDDPGIDLIINMRPTKSTNRWVQLLGRGTRPVYAAGFDLSTRDGRIAAMAASDKPNCLVLDFGRNTERLGPINDPVLPRPKGGGGGEAPVRCCEKCGCYNHISKLVCEYCGAPFPVNIKFKPGAGVAALIKEEAPASLPEVHTLAVQLITYRPHHKMGGLSSLKVTYHCGLRLFTEWICLTHPGNIRHKAEKWWLARGVAPVPETIEEAVSRTKELKAPTHIKVWTNKKHPEILGYTFKEEE